MHADPCNPDSCAIIYGTEPQSCKLTANLSFTCDCQQHLLWEGQTKTCVSETLVSDKKTKIHKERCNRLRTRF